MWLELIGWIAVFVLALAFLIKASDYFISAAEKIGLAFGLSPLVVGTLILALGTSIPELVTSIISIYSNASEVVLGNVVGSNIANISLVGGIMAIMSGGIVIKWQQYRGELFFLFLSTLLLTYFVLNRNIEPAETVILLAGYFGFIFYALKYGNPAEEVEGEKPDKLKRITWLFLIGGGIGIYLGAKFTIDSIIQISALLDIGIDIISLSAVALGTSLPELVVSVVAVRKGNTAMAMGNILGSNVFNIFGVVGIPSLLGKLVISDSVIYISIPVMLFLTFWLIVAFFIKRLSFFQGVLLLLIYIVFNIELFSNLFSKFLFD